MGTNTGIGIGIGIPFKNNVLGEGKPYLPPEIKDSLKAVVIAYGKTNNDSDRAIVKNLVDASNPFVISNAAFKLNSGFGKYETELSNTRIWTQSKETTSSPFSSNYNGLSGWIVFANTELTNSVDMPSFKIQVKGLLEGQELIYRYYDSTGQTNVYSMTKDGKYTLPADVRTAKPLTSNTSGFQIVKNETNTITITQIPSLEGAFVTDGIDDLITSTKTVQEMDITDEVTVVSMIHQIDLNSTYTIATTNYIENSNSGEHVRSDVYNYGKTGIYGYSASLINNTKSDIKNILGDEADYYVKSTNSLQTIFDAKFSVVGRISELTEASQVAWYWTIIANKVLTTDQINQVIAYFNLDRTLRPDILCNITKQGITNDNHADFNDKLVDYSGNGRDIQMNNLAWKGGSGIAAKKFETIKDYSIIPDEGLQELTIYNEFSFKIKSIRYADRYWAVQSLNKTDISYPVTIITDKDIIWRNALNYTDADGVKGSVRKETNVPANTPTQVFIYGFNDFDISDDYTKVNCVAYAARKDITEFTVTFIPSYKGGLLLDGITDFGKVTGMPVYKDYTVVADYERFYLEPITGGRASILSKSSKVGNGSFVFNLEDQNGGKACYTFGEANGNISDDITRIIRYQSKYYNTKALSIGTAEDNDFMVLGKVREVDNRYFYGAIYSLMSFPYSMSEFLIERQLKKHKLGTLYPNMVEFRPIIKTNTEWNTIEIWQGDKLLYRPAINDDKTGIYLKKDSTIDIYVKPKDADEVTKIVVNGTEYTNLKINSNGFYYVTFPITKSPQKINITIDEYIRYEDIVQPYPVLLRFNDENGNEVSWGR